MHAESLHPPSAVRHVVCFEEAGECTLERIAREAVAGDAVVVLGPEPWVDALRAFGLSREVPVARFGRAGNIWRLALPSMGSEPDGRTLCYGPQAKRLTDRTATLATVHDALPAAPQWPETRRARLRRELGIATRDRALLVAGEPSEWIDLSFVARAVGMAFVGGSPLRLVVSPRAPRIAEINGFLAKATGFAPLIVDARADRPWEILPALDAAIVDRDGAVERPVECAGWRSGEWQRLSWSASPLPALWALSCGVPVFVHESIDLGAHAAHPLVKRFGRDIAALARLLI
ncbi:MAG: hypothetical protein RLY21_226 [Planctomycetota bacterium]|jgi:hypothetical protein